MAKQYYQTQGYDSRRSVGHLIRRASNLLTMQVEHLFTEKDLTFIQYVVLMYVRDGLATNSAEICQRLRYDSGAFTRIVDQLEKRGFLKRERSCSDRRVISLKLTAQGRKTVESQIPHLVEYYNVLLAEFSPEEADTFISLLSKFIGQLSKVDA